MFNGRAWRVLRGMGYGVLLTTTTKPTWDLKVPRKDTGNQKGRLKGRPCSEL